MAKYDRPLGAFINLESTGPGGPDYLFQHTGTYHNSSPSDSCFNRLQISHPVQTVNEDPQHTYHTIYHPSKHGNLLNPLVKPVTLVEGWYAALRHRSICH